MLMVDAERDSPAAFSLNPSDSTNLKTAARIAGVAEQTVVRWARRYGIGRQLSPGAPWRIDAPALIMVALADSEALDAYRAGDRSSGRIAGYIEDAEKRLARVTSDNRSTARAA